jgi:DnaK suppressor protein
MRADLDHQLYRSLLEQRVEALNQEQASHKQAGAPVTLDQASVGRLSRMDALQQQAMAQATLRRLEIERQRIQTALNRMQSGDYGYCVSCDAEIAEARLKLDPASRVCIACARRAEGK